jgi:CMP/dCMP kinase
VKTQISHPHIQESKIMVITIDGPAASGKSFVAKNIAKRFGFFYLYTGLLYRATAYIAFCSDSLPDKNQESRGKKTLSNEELSELCDLEYTCANGHPEVIFKGENITGKLTSQKIANLASEISLQQSVRSALLEKQREVAEIHNVVADGRDCGTVVFPDAKIKFFLTASLEARASRRFTDEFNKNYNPQNSSEKTLYDKMVYELKERDIRDSTREIAPLVRPEDAIEVDNTNLNKQETLDFFIAEIESAT